VFVGEEKCHSLQGQSRSRLYSHFTASLADEISRAFRPRTKVLVLGSEVGIDHESIGLRFAAVCVRLEERLVAAFEQINLRVLQRRIGMSSAIDVTKVAISVQKLREKIISELTKSQDSLASTYCRGPRSDENSQ
jgi:hypothetical protein